MVTSCFEERNGKFWLCSCLFGIRLLTIYLTEYIDC